MNRKDCEIWSPRQATEGTRRLLLPPATLLVLAVSGLGAAAPVAPASAIRVWPTAVVTGEDIRIDDLCDFTAYEGGDGSALRQGAVAEAPRPGGSRIIHIDLVRQSLQAAGANMATLRLGGSIECRVSRPAALSPSTRPVVRRGNSGGPDRSSGRHANADSRTLRQHLVEYFDAEFARYRGRAEVIFDNEFREILGLTAPPYEFRIRRRGNAPLGLTSLEIEVLDEDDTLQVVPMVLQVRLVRDVVVARRAINQDATIRADDLARKTISFTRLNNLGLDGTRLVIGQRAKRFIQAGTVIAPSMLEAVPLVLRGQLVSVVTGGGGVRVVTSGRAASDGMLGEVVRIRLSDDRRIEFDGVVAGPGRVQVGGRVASAGGLKE